MKKTVAIVLLSLYLAGTNQVQELLKLPVLFEHYVEHKEKSPEMNFWKYLCLHYSKESPHNNDSAHKSQLPFKTQSSNAADWVYVSVQIPDFDANIKTIPANTKQCLLYAGFRYSSNYHSAIWQPPKMC